MKVEWIDYPVSWDEIKSYLVDDTGEIEKNGKFLGVFDDSEMVGAFLIRPWSMYCYEIHGGVVKKYWGRGDEICDMAGSLLFNSTPCLKIVAIVPEFNRPIIRCIENLGMVKEGLVTKSYMKWSKLHNQIVYGITKRQYRKRGPICRQQQ